MWLITKSSGACRQWEDRPITSGQPITPKEVRSRHIRGRQASAGDQSDDRVELATNQMRRPSGRRPISWRARQIRWSAWVNDQSRDQHMEETNQVIGPWKRWPMITGRVWRGCGLFRPYHPGCGSHGDGEPHQPCKQINLQFVNKFCNY